MNCHDCEPLLSACIDEELDASTRAGVDAHVRDCRACRVLLQDLTALHTAAGELEPLVPPSRLWYRVADSIAAERRSGAQAYWWGWRAIASLAMTLVLAAGLWRVATLLEPTAAPLTLSRAGSDRDIVDVDPETAYTRAIARLEEVTVADRDALDPETADAIDVGLMVIDQAIVESRAALQSEPGSEPAQESLVQALRRKVALLQQTMLLINEMRQGHQDGAARILPEMN